MKSKTRVIVRRVAANLGYAMLTVFALLASKPDTFGQYVEGERVWSPPTFAHYLSLCAGGTNSVPLPYFPYDPIEVPVYATARANWFIFDDLNLEIGRGLNEGPPPPPGDGEGGGSDIPAPYGYGTNDFYLSIEDTDSNDAFLILHGTTNGHIYQILTKTNIHPKLPWVPEQFIVGASNQTPFTTARQDRPDLFFRAARGGTNLVSIFAGTDAIAPYPPNDPGQIGHFLIERTNVSTSPLTVLYYVTGTASNGCQYSLLSGSVTIPANTNTAVVQVQPITNCFVLFEETVTLTLVVTNGYYLDPDHYTATIFLENNPSIFQTVLTNIVLATGIDYHQPSNSLLISAFSAGPIVNNFFQVYTNIIFTNSAYVTNVVVTNWTDIADLGDETKLTTIKSTGNGFTNGEMYFSSGPEIGRVDPYGTNFDKHWGPLTNSTTTNNIHIRGSIYQDQTGIYSNHLLVVTGWGGPTADTYGVWEIDAARHSRLITSISGLHLEGVITLTNDVKQWGPWAGKLLTGDEALRKIYAVDTNGSFVEFELGIDVEDLDVIPPNQDLYCTDPDTDKVLKISSTLLADYVGDLLITQAGETSAASPGARLFVVRWDGERFVKRNIFYFHSGGVGGHLEHSTFSPISVPPVQ